MNNAIYQKDMYCAPQKITVNRIRSRRHYLEKYIGRLSCATPGCTARLTYAETPNLKVKKMFKTAKHSEHIPTCPHLILYDDKKKRTLVSGEINQALSSKHKRDILSKLYYRNVQTDTAPLDSPKAPRKKKNPKPDSKPTSTPTYKTVPSIDPDAPPAAEGVREASVKKRKCKDVLIEDVGKLLGMDGYVSSATIHDDYIDFWLSSSFSIRFYNAFRDASKAAYELVERLAENIISTKPEILICFIGIVEKTNYGYQVQVMEPSLITFNNLSIYNYFTQNQEV